MQNKTFCEALNAMFAKYAPCLKAVDDNGFIQIIDNEDNKIDAFPILKYEDRYVSTNTSECYINLSLCYKGQCTEIVCIKSGKLLKLESYISLFGNKPFANFDGDSWNLFFEVIKAMLLEMRHRSVYQYSGWSQEMDRYLFGKLLIDAENAQQIQTTVVKAETCLSQKTSIEICEAVDDIVKNLSSNIVVGYICLMFLLLSHIKQRLVEMHSLAPELVLSIVGITNSYKTSTSMALFNTLESSVTSFEDTLASIRRVFQQNKSGVVIVDDYKISNRSNDDKYEKVVRLSGDIHTTGKYVSKNKVVDTLITGMCVITGEKRPHLQQSSYSRILFIDLEETPFQFEYVKILQKNKGEINSFIVLFIQFVLRKDDFDSSIIELFEKHRDELLQEDSYKGMYGRYYSMYGWFAAIWDMYVLFMQKHGVNVEIDIKEKLKQYIHLQHIRYDNNPLKLFKIGYDQLLSSNELVLTDKEGAGYLNFDVFEDGNKLFLRSNSAYKKICKFWKERGIDFPCSERKLRQLLNEEGLLEIRNGKFTTERKTADNRSYSGYYLFKNTFMNFGGIDNDEY